MMFLRITVAQTISFLIVLFIFWKGKIMGRKGLLIKQKVEIKKFPLFSSFCIHLDSYDNIV